MSDKAIITCAVTGLTDPREHPVPVTAAEMASACKEAMDAGAAIVHIHFREQEAERGHIPTWCPDVAEAVTNAIREACPGIIINMTTGTMGLDIAGPLACMERIRPDIATCNAGSLNYLPADGDGIWLTEPKLFQNPVSKIRALLEAMAEYGVTPEFECFDVGTVCTMESYVKNGLITKMPDYNFVLGVPGGMPADTDILPLLLRYKIRSAPWQASLAGEREIWPVHQAVAEGGGMLRSGLEDTQTLPDGRRATSNGALVEELVKCVHQAGRSVASPDEARKILCLP